MTDLSTRALLTTLNISQWTARKYDRAESKEVSVRHGTNIDVARVNKSLLPLARQLDTVHKITGQARNYYLQNSLPWMEGVRIIPSDAYLAFAQNLSEIKLGWQTAVEDFVGEYPKLRENARLFLNTLYNDADYPEPDQVRHRFDFTASFMPVPGVQDFRVSLSNSAVSHLKAQLEEQIQTSLGVAMQEAWDRVYKTVEHAYERLSDPEAIFRDSLVENAVELCSILPSLNFTKDPRLEKARQGLESSLCAHDPKTLRKDEGARHAVAMKLSEIMSKMGAMYGTR